MTSSAGDVLLSGFNRSARDHADRAALEVGGSVLSYADLRELAGRVATTIVHEAPESGSRLGAVLANRSLAAYAGVLGTLRAGRGYVPLNPEFGVERLVEMLEATECRSVVVGREAYPVLPELCRRVARPLTVLAPEEPAPGGIPAVDARHTVRTRADLLPARDDAPLVEPADLAYVMYTSGSTGKPKGVMVRNDNASHYMRVVTAELYHTTPEDRFSQFAELSFDASVHDMFLAWEAGACLCVPGFRGLVDRVHFMASRRVTIVTSVPSFLAAARRQGHLAANRLPSVRILCFGGDALPAMLAEACCIAAPNCIVDNFYGPTEMTIGCVSFHWNLSSPREETENGVLPIGHLLSNLDFRIVDQQLRDVPHGTAGELLLTGAQLTPGYWKDPVRTAERYVRLPDGDDRTWYRSGDVVRQRGPGSPLMYLGRVDNQVQVRGSRVELEEVEAIIRHRLGTEELVVVPVKGPEGTVEMLELVLRGRGDRSEVIDLLRPHMPSYMLPKRVRVLEELPLNANGKYDRRAVAESA